MIRHTTKLRLLCLAMLASCAIPGCVQRRIYVTSDPPGAIVHINDVEIGRTPAEADFTYFGTYDVRLHKVGYKPIATGKKVSPNLHDQPIFDLAAEALPMDFRTEARWHFNLEVRDDSTDALIERGKAFRQKTMPETVSETSKTAADDTK